MDRNRHGSCKVGRARAAAFLGATALALSGCTHLSVTPDRIRSDSPGMALAGVTYSLPMLQYDLTVQRTLTSCPEPITLGDGPDGTFWSNALVLELAVTATPNQISGERYRIDYSKLDSWLKTTTFNIEYQPGSDLLKSVNVSVEDHTGEVMGNVVKAGLAAVAVASGPAGLGAVATAGGVAALGGSNTAYIAKLRNDEGSRALMAAIGEEDDLSESLHRRLAALVHAHSKLQPLLICTETAAAQTKARREREGTLKDRNASLKQATAAVEAFTKLAEAKALPPQRRAALAQRTDALLKLTDQVARDKEAIEGIDKTLGGSQTLSWPRSFDETGPSAVAALSPRTGQKLADLLVEHPINALVIDPQALADALERDGGYLLYRLIAPDFIDAYLTEEGKARHFSPAPKLAGCSGELDRDTCITSLTTLGATLRAVKADQLEDCTAPPQVAPPFGWGRECIAPHTQAAAWADARRKAQGRRGEKPEERPVPDQVDAREGAVQQGLFVRPPVRATLLICRLASGGESATDAGCAESGGNLVKDDKVLAPQLGQLRFFRLVNQAFSNNGLMLSLSKDGVIEKFQYASTKSLGQGLSATAADVATQVAAFDKARRAEHDTNADPVAALKKQIDLKTAQQKLAAFDAPAAAPTAAEVAALAKTNAEIDYLRAQKAVLEAQAAVAASAAINP